jgi:hypothetical protein
MDLVLEACSTRVLPDLSTAIKARPGMPDFPSAVAPSRMNLTDSVPWAERGMLLVGNEVGGRDEEIRV